MHACEIVNACTSGLVRLVHANRPNGLWCMRLGHALMSACKGDGRLAKRKGCNMSETTFTAKELAAACGTDGKTFRRFVRESGIIDACGQGNRYGISKSDAHALIDAFKAKGVRKAHAPERSVDDVLALLADDVESDDVESDESDA